MFFSIEGRNISNIFPKGWSFAICSEAYLSLHTRQTFVAGEIILYVNIVQ